MFKALIGAAVVVLLAVLSKTRNYYIAGLVPLFPTFALIAHYIVGKGRSLDDLKTTIVFGMWSIIPYFVYLAALYLLVERFRLETSLALARGDLDLVVTADPVELPGITYVPLFTYEALLAVANQHALAGRPYVVPEDLERETLITYPVERDRLDVFTRFLDPADVEPAQVRIAELTVMMMQLVASGRGVCCLPNWALHEYSSRGYVTARRLGEKGLYCTLFAAIRTDMFDAPFMRDFLLTAKDTSFATLEGVSAAKG